MNPIQITSVQLSQCWRICGTLIHLINREGLEGWEGIPIGSVVCEALDLKACDRRWDTGGDWAIAPTSRHHHEGMRCSIVCGKILVAFRGEPKYSELFEGWRPCWESEVGVWVHCYSGCRVNVKGCKGLREFVDCLSEADWNGEVGEG